MATNPSGQSLFARIGGRAHIQKLLHHFYADVRQHTEIGPIFTGQIKNWHTHLEKIADFWSGVTGGPALYSGPMPMKHIPLGLEERHFEAWLGLWRRNCQIYLQPEPAKELVAAAEMIALRLRQIVGIQKSEIS